VQSLDSGAIAFLNAGFVVLHRQDCRINSTLELVRIRDREIEEQHTAGEALTNARYNTSHIVFTTRFWSRGSSASAARFKDALRFS